MKSKLKKILKRCTIFLTVFVICFSSCCFPSSALGDNSNGLMLTYSIFPKLQAYTNGSWVDVKDYDNYTFHQSADGSLDKMTYTWSGMYGTLSDGPLYRVLFRFDLVGPGATDYSLSFNGYVSEARDYQSHSDNPNKYIINNGSSDPNFSASHYFKKKKDDSAYYDNAEVTRLTNRCGFLFAFDSSKEVISAYEKKNKDDSLTSQFYTVSVPFGVSRDLVTFSYTLDNFSTDLFFQAPPDKEFQDYDNAEQEILDNTIRGRLEASSLFGGFGSLSSYVSTPIMAVGNIVGEFFSEIDVLNTIMRFSLSLGIFGFLVGMAVTFGKRISSSSSDRRNKEK